MDGPTPSTPALPQRSGVTLRDVTGAVLSGEGEGSRRIAITPDTVTLSLGTQWTGSAPPHAPLPENDFLSLVPDP